MTVLSIIVPTLNEEKNISKLLRKIKNLGLRNFELIIVDDSTDKTAEIAEKKIMRLKINGKVIKRLNKHGKGSAIMEGIENSRGKYIVLIDADLEYPTEKIPEILEMLKNGYDVVLTKRVWRKSFIRFLTGFLFRIIVFILFRIPFDTQSGLKGFKKSIIKETEFNETSWLWDLEFIINLRKKKYRIGIVEISQGKRYSGKSKVNFKCFIKILSELLKLKLTKSKSFSTVLGSL